MKISDFRVTPVAIGDPPLLNAAGLHAPYALRIIVELITSSGISGFGEIPGHDETLALLEQVLPRVVGSSPFNLNRARISLMDACREIGGSDLPRGRRNHVLSVVEVAMLDIMGKALGRPVCDLLGGAVRERVDFAAYLFYKHRGAGGERGFGLDPDAAEGWAAARQGEALDPEGIVRQAKAMVGEFGFKALKLKGGVFPPAEELQAVTALREAFGAGTPLRWDPNAVWKIETAVEMSHQAGEYLEYLEDPVRGQQAMARLRAVVQVPLATNMCTVSPEDLAGSVILGSEDVILADHHGWGGIRACVELGGFCRNFGRGLSMHSNSHLGISLAAMVHLAATVPNLTYSVDTHYPWQQEEVITGGRFRFEDGSLAVPREPGLGVELDREALDRLHRQYAECGLTRRNDEVEMQKKEPGWKFRPVRW